MDQGAVMWRTIGSPGFPFDEPAVRERAGAAYDRAFHPAGNTRQLAAIVTQPDRTPALASVTAPRWWSTARTIRWWTRRAAGRRRQPCPAPGCSWCPGWAMTCRPS